MTVASPAPMIAAAMMRARRRLTKAFANATSPETAIPYEPRRRIERRYFRALLDYGAVIDTGRSTYWLDPEKLRQHSVRRRKRAIGLIAAAAAIGAAIAGVASL